MNKPSKYETIMMFLLSLLAFGIVFTIFFMVKCVWPK